MIRLTSRICEIGNAISYRGRRKKFTKAETIRRMMREQKLIFGELLETKREKNQRLKREKRKMSEEEKKFVDHEIPVDSEFSWTMRVSESRLRRISVIGSPNDMLWTLPSADVRLAGVARATRLTQVQTRIFRKSTGRRMCTEQKIGSTHEKQRPLEIFESRLSDVPPKSSQAEENADGTTRSEVIAATESRSCQARQKNLSDTSYKASSIVIPKPKDIAQRIEGARIFNEEKIRYADDSWQREKILSILSKENKESLGFPSVTKILNLTMSDRAKKILEVWMARMIAQLGQEAFDEYKRDLLENGKLFHSSIDRALRKLPIDVPDKLKPCFDSVRSVLDDVKHVRAIESHVVHEKLGYRGILDCVASYRGNLCLIDWKKSDTTKNFLSSTYDAPLQLASYVGALNSDKNYPFQIKSGLLVIAYTTGNQPTIYQLDEKKLQNYWNQWLERLKKYYTMQNT